MDLIYRNVLIGNSRDAQNLEPHIPAVLNVAMDLDTRYGAAVISAKVGLHDRQSSDPSDVPCNRAETVVLAAKVLGEMAKHNNYVLVHCHCGLSRSTTVVALWLVREHNFDLDAAITTIRARRAGALRKMRRSFPGATIPHLCQEKLLRQILED